MIKSFQTKLTNVPLENNKPETIHTIGWGSAVSDGFAYVIYFQYILHVQTVLGWTYVSTYVGRCCINGANHHQTPQAQPVAKIKLTTLPMVDTKK